MYKPTDDANDTTSSEQTTPGTWQAWSHTGQWWHQVAPEERSLHNWVIIDRDDWDGIRPPLWLPADEMPEWARGG